jgi:hypothetical protein
MNYLALAFAGSYIALLAALVLAARSYRRHL